MRLLATCRQGLGWLAITLVLAGSLPMGHAQAGLVSTEAVIAETFGTSAERARVETFLARADVQEQFAALGVDPAEAASRIAVLDDAEIETIVGQLDQLPAGEGLLATTVIIAGVALVVLIITDIAGITNVFTFIR